MRLSRPYSLSHSHFKPPAMPEYLFSVAAGVPPVPMHREHLAWPMLVRASPSVPRSEVPFRAARCRPLRQTRWLPLQPQASAKHVPDSESGRSLLGELAKHPALRADIWQDSSTGQLECPRI